MYPTQHTSTRKIFFHTVGNVFNTRICMIQPASAMLQYGTGARSFLLRDLWNLFYQKRFPKTFHRFHIVGLPRKKFRKTDWLSMDPLTTNNFTHVCFQFLPIICITI